MEEHYGLGWEPFSLLMWFKIGDGSGVQSQYGSWYGDVVLKYIPDSFLRDAHKESSFNGAPIVNIERSM
jgi:hypothetical protein